MTTENEHRIQRERDFHDDRFRDDSLRSHKVGRFYRIARSIDKQYVSTLALHAPNASVLEYGCGTGSKAFELATLARRVVGIDISEVAMEIAHQESIRRDVADKCEFVTMNAEALQFESNSFDLICGAGILHHLNLDLALSEIARVLRPGGHAAFVEPLGHNFLINLYRRLTPALRTDDEHPLRVEDLQNIESRFPRVQIDHFFLTSIIAALPGLSALNRPLSGLDRLLFRLDYAKKQAWQVLIQIQG